jgi:hypothetical protein
LPCIERAFYPAQMNSQDPDRLIYGRIAGTAAKHTPAWRLGGQAKAVAIADLAEAADGRAGLLAKCAHYQGIAEPCIAAWADKTLMQPWIDVGRQRAATATPVIPYTGLPPDG